MALDCGEDNGMEKHGNSRGWRGRGELLLKGEKKQKKIKTHPATTNKQQSSVLSHCLSSRSRPPPPSSDLWTRHFHANSPVALFTCSWRRCARSTLIINIIMCLWWRTSSHKSTSILFSPCWSNDETNFVTSFFFLFVSNWHYSAEKTHLLSTRMAQERLPTEQWRDVSVGVDDRGPLAATFRGRHLVIDKMRMSQMGERWRDGDVGWDRGKVKAIGEREGESGGTAEVDTNEEPLWWVLTEEKKAESPDTDAPQHSSA